MSSSIVDRLYASDQASALTNEAAREIEELRMALVDVFALIDEGWLVRDTSKDGSTTWAIDQMKAVGRLAAAHKALYPEGHT